jgi:SAM-dependent methyltransferase
VIMWSKKGSAVKMIVLRQGGAMDVRKHNREAWDRFVEARNRWTVPVGDDDINAARQGNCRILLTPTRPVPASWLEPLEGRDVLCLASGGGQQGPVLAAAGAKVTVFDNSPAQLGQDRLAAGRYSLSIETVEGDMRDLSVFEAGSFDLIVHPVSNVFVPEVRPVWNECYRVLRPGGRLLAGFDKPFKHIFELDDYERGTLTPVHTIPHSDLDVLSVAEIERRQREGVPLEFGHTLEDQIGGQIDAGFKITGLYEDRDPEEEADLLSGYISTFIATRAEKA